MLYVWDHPSSHGAWLFVCNLKQVTCEKDAWKKSQDDPIWMKCYKKVRLFWWAVKECDVAIDGCVTYSFGKPTTSNMSVYCSKFACNRWAKLHGVIDRCFIVFVLQSTPRALSLSRTQKDHMRSYICKYNNSASDRTISFFHLFADEHPCYLCLCTISLLQAINDLHGYSNTMVTMLILSKECSFMWHRY